MRFQNRTEAGQALALQLLQYANQTDVIVLGLPRGGVPVAYEIARVLQAPLDIWLVRKLGVPSQPELAMGAISAACSSEGNGQEDIQILNQGLINKLGLSPAELEQVIATERVELARRAHQYRGKRPAPQMQGRTVILVDDGIATGYTLRAALLALKQCHPARIVVAAPIGSPITCEELRSEVEEVVCVLAPEPFYAVGQGYQNFAQTTDVEVCQLLQQAAAWQLLSACS